MLSGTYIEFIKPALAQMKGFRKQLLDNVRVCEPETCGLNYVETSMKMAWPGTFGATEKKHL